MKDFKHDTKQTNYRSWKSGKHWIYASVVLAAVVGGVALEATGVTPKVLSYIQKSFGSEVVEAIANTPGILARGEVLQPDFYASVADFTVPATVGTDFANNAQIEVKGSIKPKFVGSTFQIPSDKESNAIAAFNQPLDPAKDFSISGEVTVPDARIAAAGLYVSDVPSNEVINKLGTKSLNEAGSSGALKVESSAYNGHYMIFSGFHNVVGYAATLASGKDYSRVSKNGIAGIAPSNYADCDFVLLNTTEKNRTNVKIQVNVEYSAASGILKVTYKHNSGTGDIGIGQYYQQWLKDKNSKFATVEYKIDKSAPVYLGIVGNGNDSGSGASKKTSSITVNSVTGTYLTAERAVHFRDDAGNQLAASSKVVMPRGGRLGIGNKDTTTPYYYDKPDMPQGYTYQASQNPSVGGDKEVVVTYQRDVQTGFVDRTNKLTGQKMDPNENVAIKSVTKQNLSVNVPGVSGYYYLNEITGDAKNPTYAGDGSTVDFDMTMDDTANGTNTTDSQEQVVGTYMMPSVQERILNITKPDGTTSTEKQVSTTDTDFAAIEGEYAIPGYRVIVDGVPVTDAQALQGIPAEATDRTNNLKAATDSAPQVHTITYQAEPQKAKIVYQDLTTGKELHTDEVDGLTNDAINNYETASKIADYQAKGFVLKSNTFKDGSEHFDADTTTDQSYVVGLVHDSKNNLESKDITHKVAYTIKNGFVTAPQDYETKSNITYNHFIDKHTGDVITADFDKYALDGDINQNPKVHKYESSHSDAKVAHDGKVEFKSPEVPNIKGYTANLTENTTIHYSKAKDGEVLESSVEYAIDETINITLPTDTFFYNTRTDAMIKASSYTITNDSGLPVKISIDGFAAELSNSTLPSDFALNLNVSGNKVTTPSAKLIENGLIKVSNSELITLANCLDQYTGTDAAITSGSPVNNVAEFTYGGAAKASKTLKLGYTLSLKFEDVKF